MSVYSPNNRNHGTLVSGGHTQWALAIILVGCVQLLTSRAEADDHVRAFYYDAQGVLLQIEAVPLGEMAPEKRKLIDINDSVLPIPLVTEKTVPLVSGTGLSMSRFATLAVYYTYDGTSPGNSDKHALPTFVEYLGFVKDREFAQCLAIDPNHTCILPKRCHCMLSGCCCF